MRRNSAVTKEKVAMLKRRLNKTPAPPLGCALSICVRFLRGAWTANILWYLRNQPRRYSELKADLSSISSKVLAQRLRRLENDGLIVRIPTATSPPSVEYALSGLGKEVQPALALLVSIGEKIKSRTEKGSSA
jgi:DNA-binding HxlR family transcriptional regulator